MKKNKGITLIALVITIVILLILAGISIASLTGSGLFDRAKESKEKSIEAQIKEEIEMAIMDIQIEEISKGNNVTLELLEKELPNKLKDLEAELNGEEIEGEYKDYGYTIDKDLNVEMNGPMSGEKPTITFSVNTTDIGASEVIITATATVSDGTIEKIIKPDGTETNGAEATFTVNESGIYVFKAISSTGRKAKDKIGILNIKPTTPIIKILQSGGYPTITPGGGAGGETIFEIEASNSEVIKNYYSIDGGTNWEIYTGKVTTSEKNIMAKSVIEMKDGQKLESSIAEETIETLDDALKPEGYNGIWDDLCDMGYSNCKFYIDENCWGMQLRVDFQLRGRTSSATFSRSIVFSYYNENNELIHSTEPISASVWEEKSVNHEIPIGTKYVILSQAEGNQLWGFREIAVITDPDIIIIKNGKYPTFTRTGVNVDETLFRIESNNKSELVKNYYSIDDGKTWIQCNGLAKTTANKILAKCVVETQNEKGIESKIIEKEITVPSDALGVEGYDGTLENECDMAYNNCKFYIDESCWGLKIKIDWGLYDTQQGTLGYREFVFSFFDDKNELISKVEGNGCSLWGYNSVELDIPEKCNSIYISQKGGNQLLKVREVTIIE